MTPSMIVTFGAIITLLNLALAILAHRRLKHHQAKLDEGWKIHIQFREQLYLVLEWSVESNLISPRFADLTGRQILESLFKQYDNAVKDG